MADRLLSLAGGGLLAAVLLDPMFVAFSLFCVICAMIVTGNGWDER